MFDFYFEIPFSLLARDSLGIPYERFLAIMSKTPNKIEIYATVHDSYDKLGLSSMLCR